MVAALLAGAAVGLALAVPVGPVAVLLLGTAARTSWRVGAAAAAGVATTDAGYAALAVGAGAPARALLAPARDVLRLLTVAVLLAVAVATVRAALSQPPRPAAVRAVATPVAALRTYLLFVGLTAVNPATLAVVLAVVADGRRATGPWFVTGVAGASLAWQLVLATAGTGLGRILTRRRGRVVAGVASGILMAGLAVSAAVG